MIHTIAAPPTNVATRGNDSHTGLPYETSPPETNHNPRTASGAAAALGKSGIKDNLEGTAQVSTPTVAKSKRIAQDRQRVMWEITMDPNLRGCHRYPISSEVALTYGGEGVEGKFAGLQNTGSRWGSPLAARSVQHEMKVRLATAIKNHMAGGGVVVYLVNTVPHHRGQSLAKLLEGLRKGMTAQHKGTWSKDKDRYGIVHTYSDYELTWGVGTGYHPHKNTVYFLEKALSETQLEALQASLFGRFAKGVMRAGLRSPHHEYGLSIQQVARWGADAATVAGYVTKGGLGLASEITSTDTKTAHEGRFTPGEMLDLLAGQKAETGDYDPVVVAAYREYEREFKGLRSSWSRGAKKALEVDHITEEAFTEMEAELFELAGVEPVERRDPAGRWVVVGVPAAEWKKIRSDFAARDAVEGACGLAETPEDAQALAGAVLDRLGVGWLPRMIPVGELEGHVDDTLPTDVEALARDLRTHVLESV